MVDDPDIKSSSTAECSCIKTDVVVPSKWRFLMRIIRSIVFFACLVGFIYQAVTFVQHFYNYPTVVTIEIKYPPKIPYPAITFCNINPVQRSAYCSKYPANCEKPEDMEQFCKKKPRYCRNSNVTDILIPKQQYLSPEKNEETLTNQDIKELSQNASRLLHRSIYGEIEEQVTPVFFYEWPNLGNIHQCFTENYLGNKTDPHFVALSNKNTATSYILVGIYHFNLEEDEIFDPDAESGLLFSIHSPYETVNPYFKGNLIKSGSNLKIHLRLEEQNFLPYPYETDCINYEQLWQDNKTRPRTQNACKESCYETYTLSCHGCLFNSNTITLDNIETVCNSNDIAENNNYSEDYVDEGLEKWLDDCTKSCKKDCRKLVYLYTIEEQVLKPDKGNPESKNISIWISIPDPEVIVLSHRPQFMDVELFSSIGGFIGYWLGISVWALFEVFKDNFVATINCLKNKI
ncbi:hypothetical protein JTE90_015800 [Oedothorax gibbosus]|uniref:Uncharacterized protein n=1 Tax=Oedothorax gibbosus TaxID=931172 RepID=A0AAV6UBD7_9ARAC|nr:hypothetical protein JTE90_015800 [Oedothorax gibbosus]